jgi:hypothetical protein
MRIAPLGAARELAGRYERVRQAYRLGQSSNEISLLLRQGMSAWMREWQQAAATAAPGGDGLGSGGVAENGHGGAARSLSMAEMVSIAAAMISGRFEKERGL